MKLEFRNRDWKSNNLISIKRKVEEMIWLLIGTRKRWENVILRWINVADYERRCNVGASISWQKRASKQVTREQQRVLPSLKLLSFNSTTDRYSLERICQFFSLSFLLRNEYPILTSLENFHAMRPRILFFFFCTRCCKRIPRIDNSCLKKFRSALLKFSRAIEFANFSVVRTWISTWK